ncbi:NAD(P)/FAD-dependent oxidoreductase [Rapidithrix thailandica]|uniref:NAD(P)/FAD-dependent oxidoreductase n=1 Tax=Rapidithrix thailandica TaxID=413964 RepID=A0AAW9S0C8_9BACT
MSDKNLDVIVIGGGPAGMNAALVLGRAMVNAVVINEENPRNRITQGSYGFVTRDGIHPLEFLKIAKHQLEKYNTVQYVRGLVAGVKREDEGYLVNTQNNDVFKAPRVVFATGYKDDLRQANLKGVEKVYGISVFPCPFCDGWERKNQPLALFGEERYVVDFAKTVSNWTKDLIVFTNGKKMVSEAEKKMLLRHHVEVEEEKVSELLSENGQLTGVELLSGKVVHRTGGFLMNTGGQQSTLFPVQLGVEEEEYGTYETNQWGKTSVEGIYIVGDAKNSFTGSINSAAEGFTVAEMIVHEIIDERWDSQPSFFF